MRPAMVAAVVGAARVGDGAGGTGGSELDDAPPSDLAIGPTRPRSPAAGGVPLAVPDRRGVDGEDGGRPGERADTGGPDGTELPGAPPSDPDPVGAAAPSCPAAGGEGSRALGRGVGGDDEGRGREVCVGVPKFIGVTLLRAGRAGEARLAVIPASRGALEYPVARSGSLVGIGRAAPRGKLPLPKNSDVSAPRGRNV